ncbi:MAG: hypothetical protein IV086_13590 [Hyphomonadaceae bacterium]|nr:MAG: hypothetical protein FD160_1938 [Caulobacteraceae bacterium]MBT9446728.1 hypothetical protein [Hyphomonadaceae bacterium]TPW06763.1 MAG: hypothetical protein FD124_1563 [Alphaproteobacteria bacterium]
MVKAIVAAVLAIAALQSMSDVAAAQATTTQSPAPPPSPPAASPPVGCSGAAHRAFDFWIGEWDAYATGTETLAGKSVIEARDAGCIITEQWTSMRSPYSGRSLNLFDATTGRWLQFWADSQGEITRYEGAPTGDGMVLVAPDEATPGQAGRTSLRMTFTRNPDGTVRQVGETSGDGGKTWAPNYDFTYRPRSPG